MARGEHPWNTGPKGYQRGRPPLSDEKIAEIRRLREEGFTTNQVAKRLGVAWGTVAKYYDYRK